MNSALDAPGRILTGAISVYWRAYPAPSLTLFPGLVWPGNDALRGDCYGEAAAGVTFAPVDLPAEAVAALADLLTAEASRCGGVEARITVVLRRCGRVGSVQQLATLTGYRRETICKAVNTLARAGDIIYKRRVGISLAGAA